MNETIKCPYCNKVFFNLDNIKCPFCGGELIDLLTIFKDIFKTGDK